MKHLIILLANLFLAILCFGQSDNTGNFVEFGIKSSKFIESSFLKNSTYRNQLSDPSTNPRGFKPSSTGKSVAAKLKFGKGLSMSTSLVAELGFSKRNEQVIYFCHACDLIVMPVTLVEIYSADFAIGIRQRLLEFRKFSLYVEGLSNYALSTSESGLDFFGYAIHPIVQYNYDEKLGVNFKYGFEQSFNEYEKKERYAELAVNYRLYQNNKTQKE